MWRVVGWWMDLHHFSGLLGILRYDMLMQEWSASLLPNLRRPSLHIAPTEIYERLLPIALSRLTIYILLLVPKNGVSRCETGTCAGRFKKTVQFPLIKHYRAFSVAYRQAGNSSQHCFLMCGGPEPRGTWGLTKAFVSFGLQKKFVLSGNRGWQGSTGGLLFECE